jgi:TusA-related sulfurtransferase
MKRTLQLLGEMKNYQLPQAKRAVEEMAANEELVIILPEQSLAEAIQQWATGQGYTASNPKKSGEGIIRWQVSVQKAASSGEKAPAGVPTVPS